MQTPLDCQKCQPFVSPIAKDKVAVPVGRSMRAEDLHVTEGCLIPALPQKPLMVTSSLAPSCMLVEALWKIPL